MDYMNGTIGNIYEKVRNHIVDTTAILVASNPIFTISENVISGMSDKLSLANRINGSALFYLGAGYVFAKGRDFYYDLLKIDKDSKLKGFHDAVWGTIYGALFNGAVTATNVQSLDEIVVGAVSGALTGGIAGAPSGYAIDAFRDLTDVNPSERLPKKIRNLPSKIKKGIVAGVIAASIGLTGGIYKATPENYQGLKGYFVEQTQDESRDNKNHSNFLVENFLIP